MEKKLSIIVDLPKEPMQSQNSDLESPGPNDTPAELTEEFLKQNEAIS